MAIVDYEGNQPVLRAFRELAEAELAIVPEPAGDIPPASNNDHDDVVQIRQSGMYQCRSVSDAAILVV